MTTTTNMEYDDIQSYWLDSLLTLYEAPPP
jgi:hypothetical protein